MDSHVATPGTGVVISDEDVSETTDSEAYEDSIEENSYELDYSDIEEDVFYNSEDISCDFEEDTYDQETFDSFIAFPYEED